MSDNQKHKVATDALDTLGTCPIPEGSGRDAIHLAVEPAIGGMWMMQPGEHGCIVDGVVVPAHRDAATGIVDPFLKGPVHKGDRFWFVVLPRTITSLRHVWSHPAFPEDDIMSDGGSAAAKIARLKSYMVPDDDEAVSVYVAPPESLSKADIARFADEVTSQGNDTVPAADPQQSMAKAWMKAYCDSIGERYDYVMDGAKEFLETGAYTYGEQDSGNLEGVYLPPEFWEKYQTIVGSEVPVKDRQDFFTCSC